MNSGASYDQDLTSPDMRLMVSLKIVSSTHYWDDGVNNKNIRLPFELLQKLNS